ncbi:hypothetical protein [Actinoplanes sp. NPDC089786]|uniref:hypothetical protein n=1 Tax=Actinoplanes sp. NPDC089786 TaxID=3155185 RepID=UPI003420D96E
MPTGVVIRQAATRPQGVAVMSGFRRPYAREADQDRVTAVVEERWNHRRPALDVLASCGRRLERAVPEIAGYEASYCRRLLDLTMLILQA